MTDFEAHCRRESVGCDQEFNILQRSVQRSQFTKSSDLLSRQRLRHLEYRLHSATKQSTKKINTYISCAHWQPNSADRTDKKCQTGKMKWMLHSFSAQNQPEDHKFWVEHTSRYATQHSFQVKMYFKFWRNESANNWMKSLPCACCISSGQIISST